MADTTPLPLAVQAPRPLALAGRGAGDMRDAEIEEAARAFESAFLSEMLQYSGLGKAPDAFGGGEGEQHFASMLQAAQARKMVDAGGIGIAEYIVRALQEKS